MGAAPVGASKLVATLVGGMAAGGVALAADDDSPSARHSAAWPSYGSATDAGLSTHSDA